MLDKWITCDKQIETPVFEKPFYIDKIPNVAEIDISALGYFTLLINGQPVTDELFTPAQTDYAPRNDLEKQYNLKFNTTYRVLYLTYNIKDFLQVGKNTVKVIVGNGYWRQRMIYTEGSYPYSDELVLSFDIKLDDKIISTDGTEKAYPYPIIRSNMFFGEIIDMRMFHEEQKQVDVTISNFKPQNLTKQVCPPERIVKVIVPTKIGDNLYDCGENVTGWVYIKVKGNPGDEIRLEYAEEIKEGQLDHITYSPPWRKSTEGEQQTQYEIYYLSGNTDEIRPMFVYHGFRYFTITAPENVEFFEINTEVVHTDLRVTTEFNCDNDVLSWLYKAFIRTQLNNSHGSIPSDCPTRERLGYTGDGQVTCSAVSRIFEAKEFYKKWLQDIYDCQDTESGRIQNTAPFMGGGGGHGGWGSAIVFVPYYCYKAYGDISFLENSYERMKRWLEYMLNNCENDILCKIEGTLWNLGDWASTDEMEIPVGFVNNCSLVKQLEYMAEISDLLKKSDKVYYLELAEKYKKATLKEYYKDNEYCSGTQGANAFAIWAKMPHYETLIEPLVFRYRTLNKFDTGFIGTFVLIEVLSNTKYRADAINLLTSKVPNYSFGSMMDNNQTTIGEYFNGDFSHDHPMFGAPVVYLFRNLLGINDESYISGKVTFNPCLDSIVNSASGSVMTAFGKTEIRFNIADKTTIEINVPNGLSAELIYCDRTYKLESGKNEFTF